ncbi:MAG: hypothetical protein AB7P03_16925 [Kofleriaceae bacterium]
MRIGCAGAAALWALGSVGGSGCGRYGLDPIDRGFDAPSIDGAPVDAPPQIMELPVRELPGLASIVFWERTGGTAPTSYTFTVNGPELTGHLPDPLGDTVYDIHGATSEFYDVYYSDRAGVFDIDGAYLTISGVYPIGMPFQGGLNLAEIELVWSGSSEFGNTVASYVALGDNAEPMAVGNCIDGSLETHTRMGNTSGTAERLRITLGFPSTVIIY